MCKIAGEKNKREVSKESREDICIKKESAKLELTILRESKEV